MNNPAEIVIAFFELVEAEFREIRRSLDESVNLKTGSLGRAIMRLAGSVALILAAIVLILASVGMLLWSMYLYISQFMNPAQAALITGIATLFAAGILIIIVRWLNR
ncbi:MAG: hypothetical protein V3U60_17060 [Gammaproteobacteria bacterium]